MGNGQSGFTLVEILVVVAIMVLLAAMLFPVFGALDRHQEISTCALNLKSIGTALRMYRDDWGAFPPDVSEPYKTFSYGGNDHTVNGLGLYLLYHLYQNAEGGSTADPTTIRYNVEAGDYLRRVEFLHCPANPRDEPDFSLLYGSVFPGDGGYWPPAYLGNPAAGGTYDGYDWYYRRHRDGMGKRQLDDPATHSAYPPDNTVVTWCTFHRDLPPRTPEEGISQPASEGFDIVLWVDGSVERMPAAQNQFSTRKP